MKAKTEKLIYVKGDFSISQGVKGGGTPGRSYYSKGVYHEDQGFGWRKNYISSKLILPTISETGYHEVRVDRFFKDNVGKLTKRRRDKLEEARPETVNIVKPEGSKYYEVDERELWDWKNAAGL